MKALVFKIKQTIWVSPFCLAILLALLKSQALTIEEVPNPRQLNGTWVTDMAEILDEPTQTKLNSLISEWEAKTSLEMAVVTVPETTPSASPKEFATALFNYWGIGKKGKDNGVLFLISKGDRRVEIETGYGLAAILPSAKVSNIIDTQIIPRFKQGDFNGGTLVGTKALIVALVALDASHPSSASKLSTTTGLGSKIPQNSFSAQLPSVSEESTQEDGFPWLLLAGRGGMLLSLISGIGLLVVYHRPALIEPQGRYRIKALDDHDKPVYYLVCLCLFCTTFTVATAALVVYPGSTGMVALSLVGSSLAGGINCVLFSRWLHRSKRKRSNDPKFTYDFSLSAIAGGCFLLLLFAPFVLPLALISLMMLLMVVGLIAEVGGGGLIVALITGEIIYLPLSWLPKKIFDEDRPRRSIRPLHCAKCQQLLTQVNSQLLLSHLTAPEVVARNIGSVVCQGWECPSCSRNLIGQGINLRTYVVDSERFSLCPICKELTVTRTEEVLEAATYSREGKKLIADECLCCSYRKAIEKIIPRISSSVSSGGSFSTGGISTGGSGSCGGSFGGGSSGGGGAGGGF